MLENKNLLYPNLYRCLTESKFWCSCAYSHLNISTLGQYRICCNSKDFSHSAIDTSISEHFNSEEMRNIRFSFENSKISDIVKKHCYKCLLLESKNIISKRIKLNTKLIKNVLNKTWEPYLSSLEQTITDSINDQYIDINKIKFRSFDLEFFGNQCNLKCIMCRAEKSSTFDKVINRYPDIEKNLKFIKEFKFVVTNTPILKFTGGEPVINKTWINFLKQLVDCNLSKELRIDFVTNGMCYSSELVSILNEFKSSSIFISIDGYSTVNSLQRIGSNFELIDKNIDRYKQDLPNSYMEVLTTITPLNCSNLIDIYLYVTYKNVEPNFICNVVSPPTYDISHLPDMIRHMYLEKLENSKYNKHFQNTIQFLKCGKYNEDIFKTYLTEILTKHSKETLLKYFPEYDEFFKKFNL